MRGMTRILRAIAGALLMVAAAPSLPVHAAPAVPDFESYPTVSADDYTVRPGLAYSVRGFRTPSGLYCTSSMHRAMYAVDCTGPFVGAPDGANWVSLYESGTVVSPVKFSKSEGPQPAGVPEFEGTPINLLPKNTAYAFDDAICVWTDTVQLACRMGSGEQFNGFVATAHATTTFGNR